MKKFVDQLVFRSRYPAAIGAGLLLASAFPNFDCAGFAWAAPALMIAAAHGKSARDSFRIGYVAGLAFWLAALYWLLLMPATGFPILGWAALAAYLALYPAVWVWFVSNFQFPISHGDSSWSRRTLWALGGAAAWVALEMLRARLFSGFPWILLGVSQFKMIPLIQLASFTGVYGISFLIVWFSLALLAAGLMIFRQPNRRYVWQAEIVLPLVATVFTFVGGFFGMNRPAPAGDTLRVTLIQPSVPQTLIWSDDADAKRFHDLLAQSQRAVTNRTDVLVWPESAVPSLDEATYRSIVEFAQTNHVWIVFNGDDVEFHPAETNYFNSAFLINPAGKMAGIYHKRQLVIFGEYIPLVRWLPFIKWFTPITGGWTAGDRPGTFPLNHARIAPLICFEDVFPGTAREAATDDTDFLVNLTNDGWFGRSAEQWQHLANAVFRAVENGLPLVRCANNGVTGWIDAHGRLCQVFTDADHTVYGPGALTVEIPLLPAGEKRVPTYYHQHGDWFGWSCVVVTAGLLLRRLRAKVLVNKAKSA